MLSNFLKNESGQGMVEYALIIALIALAVIGALILMGGAIRTKFEDTSDELQHATT